MSKRARNLVDRVKYALASSDALQITNTLLNIAERKLQRTGMLSIPLIIQVEVTNKCNLNCIICSRHHQPLKLGDISAELIPGIVDFSRRARELILFGYGEPLLSKSFFRLIENGRSSRCSFTTNGVLLTSEMIEKIMKDSKRPLNSITFSVDAVEPETYLAIREKSDYDLVWKNIQALDNYRKSGREQTPETWMNFVAIKRNIEELPRLVKKASEYGVSQINVFHMVVWDEECLADSLIDSPELTEKMFNEARRIAEENGVRIDLPAVIFDRELAGRSNESSSEMPMCYQPWSSTYIRHDGTVQACCFSEKLVMGNIHDRTLKEIWNDAPYRKLRASVNSNPHPDCRKCELRFRYISGSHDRRTYIKMKHREQ
ncbi:MAG: radical SAM protein [Nitrospira sp.]|nr:radical SAM protein [bacterium]MBL7047988.1 radical SAM protein [Nitrospira sp.]